MRRLHPTRIRTPAARTSKGVAAVPERSVHWAGPDAHSFPRSRPFKAAGSSHRGGRPVFGGSGCGADVAVSSPAAVGGRGSVGHPQGLIPFEWPAWPCFTRGQVARPDPVTAPPSSDAAGSLFAFSHGSSPRRSSVWVATGGIGVPSKRLAARVRASNSRPGLAVTVRCHSPSTDDSALSLRLSRLAPVRLSLADPPVS